MKRFCVVLAFFIFIGNIAYSFDANEMEESLMYKKQKKETLAQRLKKEKRIELEETGEVENEPNAREAQMIEKAQIAAAKKIALELYGASYSFKTSLNEETTEKITNLSNSINRVSKTDIHDTKTIKPLNVRDVQLVPNSIRRTKDTFSARFKFALFYNKSIQLKQLKPDSILYAMATDIANGLEAELGSYKNDFYVLHYEDDYDKEPGYVIKATRCSGSYKTTGKGTSYSVQIAVTLTNNNTGFNNESKNFIGNGSSRKKVKGLLGNVLQPVTSSIGSGDTVGTNPTGNADYDFENSSSILAMGRNTEGFREAVNAAIKDVCAQIHVFVNQ